MAKLSVPQRRMMQEAIRLGRLYVYPDMRRTVDALEAKGLLRSEGILDRYAYPTDAGRAALSQGTTQEGEYGRE